MTIWSLLAPYDILSCLRFAMNNTVCRAMEGDTINTYDSLCLLIAFVCSRWSHSFQIAIKETCVNFGLDAFIILQ